MTGSSIGRGTSFPLGATVQRGGVNFSIYSRNASLVELLLFDGGDAVEPARVITLERSEHRTYHYWHVFVPDLAPGQVYAFRAIGPFDPERGLRFDGKEGAGRILTAPQSLFRRDIAAADTLAMPR